MSRQREGKTPDRATAPQPRAINTLDKALLWTGLGAGALLLAEGLLRVLDGFLTVEYTVKTETSLQLWGTLLFPAILVLIALAGIGWIASRMGNLRKKILAFTLTVVGGVVLAVPLEVVIKPCLLRLLTPQDEVPSARRAFDLDEKLLPVGNRLGR